ncbi:hypothetical protein JNK13_03275 [bacterium]|nr:hypothetical protein [bacterium]
MIDSNKIRIGKMIELLERVASGEIPASVAISEWPTYVKGDSKTTYTALHELHHYSADEDIRSKDPSYAKEQIDTLVWYASELIKESKG